MMNEVFQSMRQKFERFRQHRQAFNPSGRSWFRVAAEDSDAATIYIYDAIGFFGIEANQLVQEIDQLEASEITLRINSPGGDVFDGAAIFNALERHPATIHTKIDGLAASMASLIALSGNTVEMAENAFYMIHKPWSIVLGDAESMRSEANLLDKIEGTAVGVYANKSGMSEDDVRGLLAAETWYTADEAKAAGFADSIVGESDRENRFDLSVFANAPEQGGVDREFTKREAEVALRDAGMSREQAKLTVARGYQEFTPRDAGRSEQAENVAYALDFLSNIKLTEKHHV